MNISASEGIVLLHHPASTCSQKVRLVLFHKDISWTSRPINLQKSEHLTPEYMALNPNGVVPTLLHGGAPIYESSAITEYLDDAFPERPVRPATAIDRARMRSWCRYIDEVPTAAIRVPSFNQHIAKNWSHLSPEERERHAERLPVRKSFFLRMSKDGFDSSETQASMDDLRRCLERMQRALELHPWIVGDVYTLADVALTPTLVRLVDLGRADLWQDLPAVSAWLERIETLDNFAPTFAAPARDLQRLSVPEQAATTC